MSLRLIARCPLGPTWGLVTPAWPSMLSAMQQQQQRCLQQQPDIGGGSQAQAEQAESAGPGPSGAGASTSAARHESAQHGASAKLTLYKGKWIIPVRFLVRAKIFQLLGAGGIGLAVAGLAAETLTTNDLFWLGALGAGCVAGSFCLNYYSRRYVGELSLLPDKRTVRFSTLDFWGNRQDSDVLIERIHPTFKGMRPKTVQATTQQLLFPVNVEGDRQYYLSVQAGNILEKELLFKLLNGQPLEGSSAQSAGGGDSDSAASSPPAAPRNGTIV